MSEQLEETVQPEENTQPEKSEQQYYALARMREIQKDVIRNARALVVQRAKVEKYRQARPDLARTAYEELQRLQGRLVNALAEVQLTLMEVEEYRAAKIAGQLHDGLRGFQLMSTAYKPVYDALCNFAQELPVGGNTTNATVIGRLMNRVKLGYYPTDPDNISLILKGIQFPSGVITNVFDPCCGCGKALRQIAQGNNCFAYGVELDEYRAEEAQMRLHRVGFGSFFHSRISHEAFHLLFLNPPYLSILNQNGSRSRHEKRFLIESLCHLTYGGLLIYVIPFYRLTLDICRVLTDNFEDLSVWRFTDSEFQKFKQVAILGLRKRRDTEPTDTAWLERYATQPASIPPLDSLPEHRYAIPGTHLEVTTFRGERFNEKELEQQLRRSNSFAQLMSRSELDEGAKRPPLPLSIGQIGLVGGSGMINGLIGGETPHIIKGRIIKVVRAENASKFNGQGKHIGAEVHETITNKMIFNVLTPNGFKALA